MARTTPVIATVAAVAVSRRRLPVRMAGTEPVDTAAIAKIRDEGLNRSQVGAHVHDAGRRHRTAPDRIARVQARCRLGARDARRSGASSNARLEPFEFGRGWQLEKFTIEMVEPRYMPLLGYAEAWSPRPPGEVIAPVVSLSSARRRRRSPRCSCKGAAVHAGRSRHELHRDRPRAAGASAGRTSAGSRRPDAARRGTRRSGRTPAAEPAGGAPRAGDRPSAGATDGRPGDSRRWRRRAAQAEPRHARHRVSSPAGATIPADPLPKIVLAGEHYNMIARLAQQGDPRQAARQRAGAVPRAGPQLLQRPGGDPRAPIRRCAIRS